MHFDRLKRREFITLLGGAAAWPIAVRAQRDGRVRRIAVLFGEDEKAATARTNNAAFRERLKNLGWIEGGNIRIDYRFGSGDTDRLRLLAQELVSTTPDVIVGGGGPAWRALLQQTQSIPIVMASGADPVATGTVQNIARPESNLTGFVANLPSMGGKWVELLKEIDPTLRRIALIFGPQLQSALHDSTYFASIDAAAAQFRVETLRVPVRNPDDVERGIDSFSGGQNGGLIVMPPPPASTTLASVIQRAAQHRLPAMYNRRADAADGGLIAYGVSVPELYRNAASYVDRILRGAKPGDLPIQFPTKYELVINLRTAKTLGLDVSPTLYALADEIIE